MNKPATEITRENIIFVYSAQDKMAWVINVPMQAIKKFVGHHGDNALIALQRNTTEMSWELLEAVSDAEGFAGQKLGNLMVHLKLMHDLTRDAEPNTGLAEIVTQSFKDGDLSKIFESPAQIAKINS
jgi:hypothetical protein